MKTKLYTFTLSLIALFFGSTLFAQDGIELLYAGNTAKGTGTDSVIMDYLDLEGYNVTYVDENDFKASGSVWETADAYYDYDVLFVSEIMGSSSSKNFALAGFPIPAVSLEGYVVRPGRWGFLADDSETFFKQASSADLTADVLTLVITDIDHWITEVYDQDYYLVWSACAEPTKLGVTGFLLDDDIDGAVPLGEYLFDMGGLPSIWAIPEGSVLHDTIELPNIVLIGSIDHPDYEMNLTAEFLEFIVRSIRWVTDDYEIEGVDTRNNYNLVAGPNPTTGIVNISLSLQESGKVNVNVYDITGRIVKSNNQGVLSAGKNIIQLDISEMPEAHYIYEIVSGKDVVRGKIVKR